jgi:hypothetical protein
VVLAINVLSPPTPPSEENDVEETAAIFLPVAVAWEADTEEVAYKVPNASYKKTAVWVFKKYGYIRNIQREHKLYLKGGAGKRN